MEKATLANGCFWCTEAIFKRVKGVINVMPGYSGGEGENPTYQEVSEGTTGFAEAIDIDFDPKLITFKEILRIFFKTHDPTTLNRQGIAVGTQYRSAIFFHNDEQKKIAEEYIKELEAEKVFEDPIVTEITRYTNFYPAEDYHRNFYANNPDYGYCRVVIDPKVKKFLNEFSGNIN